VCIGISSQPQRCAARISLTRGSGELLKFFVSARFSGQGTFGFFLRTFG